MSPKEIPGWRLSADGKSIVADLKMRDFMTAIRLIEQIACLAVEADHHPDVHLTGYRNLRLELTTHSEGRLTQKDFELASKINALPKDLKE